MEIWMVKIKSERGLIDRLRRALGKAPQRVMMRFTRQWPSRCEHTYFSGSKGSNMLNMFPRCVWHALAR